MNFQEAMLHRLPVRQREVLLLVFYHGNSLEEAANILNIGLGTVCTQYDRAKKKLRELILNQKKAKDGNHG